jgi:hypothetical protein
MNDRSVSYDLPVNAGHPLNRNLKAWYYMPDSRFVSHGRVLNLTNRRSNPGVVSGPFGFNATSRNSVAFRQLAPTSFVTIPDGLVPGDATGTSGTVCGWVRSTGLWSRFRNVWLWNSRNIDVSMNGGQGGGAGAQPSGFIFSSTRVNGTITTDARWVWLAVTLRYNGTLNVYANGSSIGSSAVGTHQTQIGFTAKIWAYSDPVPNQSDWLGPYEFDDTRVYDRDLDATEIRNLYNESLRGNSETLNFVRQTRSVLVSSGSTSLTATGITCGNPTTGTPAITQSHTVAATALSISNVTFGAPALSQAHSVSATPLSISNVTFGSPSVSQVHSLTATPLSISNPSLGSPSLGGSGSLFATALTTGSPTVGSPAIGQVHAINATALSISNPTLGSPTLAGGSTSLAATGIACSSPSLGSPTITITGASNLTSEDYAFILVLESSGRDVSYVYEDGSLSTFKAVVHKARSIKDQEEWGQQQFTTRDVSFLADDARGRVTIRQYSEMRIDGVKYQIERFERNGGRWRATLKRLDVQEVATKNRRGRQ